MMKIQVFIFLLFWCVIHAAGQEIDSLGIVIEKILNSVTDQDLRAQKNSLQESTDTLSIHLILKEAEKYRESQPDSFNLLSRRALELSLRTMSLRYISQAVQNLGDYSMRKEDYTRATTCYLTSLRIEEKFNDRLRIADLNDDLGSVYYYLEIFDKSFSYHNKALAIYEHYHDTLNIARIFRHLGTLHSSREYCEKRTRQEKLEDYDTAIQYFENALRLFENKNEASGVADCRVNIGAVYNKMDKPETARAYIEKALAFYRQDQNWNRVAGTLYTLGKTYFRANELDKSIACYEESRRIAEEKGYTDGIQFLFEAMAQTYEANQDYKNAYNCYIRYMTLRDSVYNAEKSKQVLELETKYQSGLKENEILRLSLLKNVFDQGSLKYPCLPDPVRSTLPSRYRHCRAPTALPVSRRASSFLLCPRPCGSGSGNARTSASVHNHRCPQHWEALEASGRSHHWIRRQAWTDCGIPKSPGEHRT